MEMKVYKPCGRINYNTDSVISQWFGENKTCIKNVEPPQYRGTIMGICPFGYNPMYKQLGLNGHNGIDIVGIMSQNIYFNVKADTEWIADNQIDSSAGLGIVITSTKPVKDGMYIKLIFWHISKSLVTNGEKVVLGQKIAEMGNTGASTGVHLHFGMKYCDKNGNTYNHDNGYKGAVDPEMDMTFVLDLPEIKVIKTKLAVFNIIEQLELLYNTTEDLGQIKTLNNVFISLLNGVNSGI